MVTYTVQDGVAVITVDNPPVNTLNRAVRAGLVDAVNRLAGDISAEAAVIIGKGRTFPAGADIRELDAPDQAPHVPDVCNAIEDSPKPIIACLHGTALGGGYEIALAAHGRLAIPGTRIGFPEVTLGVLPGAGGTQRMPRLVKVKDTLSLMLSGTSRDVSKGLEIGLVDGIVEGDLLSAGVSHARSMIGRNITPTRDKREMFENVSEYQSAILAAREELQNSPTRAPAAILDCLEAALLMPFEAGLQLERDLFLELRDSDEAKALRHVFLASRLASKPREGLPLPRKVSNVAIIGSGDTASGIAVCCLDAGFKVVLIEHNGGAALQASARVKGVYTRAVDRGRLSPGTQRERLSRFSVTREFSNVAGADLIIEAVPEDEDLKVALFQRLGEAAQTDATIASTTSLADIDQLADAYGQPDNVVGMHFFDPAHVQPLVEVAIGTGTSPQTESTAFAVAAHLRKKPVRVTATAGLISNRMLAAYGEAADRAVLRGATPYSVDAAMRSYGFKQGPYQIADQAGLDLILAGRRKAQWLNGEPKAQVLKAVLDAGRTGRAKGFGFYAYDEGGSQPRQDRSVLALIEAVRSNLMIQPQRVSAVDVQTDCLLAMMNEGARLLDEGVAERAGDIDLVMLLGFGFPRHKGGPMKAAELNGLLPQLRKLEKRGREDLYWVPAEALRDAVKNGNRFSEVL